jgi:hypothetical protein
MKSPRRKSAVSLLSCASSGRVRGVDEAIARAGSKEAMCGRQREKHALKRSDQFDWQFCDRFNPNI